MALAAIALEVYGGPGDFNVVALVTVTGSAKVQREEAARGGLVEGGGFP